MVHRPQNGTQTTRTGKKKDNYMNNKAETTTGHRQQNGTDITPAQKHRTGTTAHILEWYRGNRTVNRHGNGTEDLQTGSRRVDPHQNGTHSRERHNRYQAAYVRVHEHLMVHMYQYGTLTQRQQI